MELHKLSVRQLCQLLEEKTISSLEVVSYFLSRIDSLNPKINAIVARNDEQSIDAAKKVDAIRSQGGYLKPLAGIPFGVKDLEDAIGFPTTYGSLLHKDAKLAKSDSLIVDRLKAAGAIAIAKTNTPEYGSSAETDNRIFGTTKNPYDLTRSSGGSSGGSAAAVALGLLPFASASDGGGSIRIPGASCGINVLKTSTGRVPISGDQPPNWWDFSTNGPIARSILDGAWLYDFVVGPHIDDPRSLPEKSHDWAIELHDRARRPRIAFSADMGYWKTDNELLAGFNQALKALEGGGFEVREAPNLFETPPILTWLAIVQGYFSARFGDLVDTPEFSLLNQDVANMVIEGLKMSASDLVKAQTMAWKISHDLFSKLADVDLLITPALAGLPPKIGEKGKINGEETLDWVSYCAIANMAKTPAGTVCVGIGTSGVPIGIQIIGKRFCEVEVLRVMRFLEEHFGQFAPADF